jgi:hypothetical protein
LKVGAELGGWYGCESEIINTSRLSVDIEFSPVDVSVGGEAWIEQVKKGRCLFRLVADLYIAQFRKKYFRTFLIPVWIW